MNNIALMQSIADEFYRAARRQSCHAFLEFAGLMNEYIKICAQNENFLNANRHTGTVMQAHECQIDYLQEKLSCIFSPFAQVQISSINPLLSCLT